MEMNWISVRDKLPKTLDDVLIHYANGCIDIGCRYSDGGPMEGHRGPVTHWMPLPEPPKEVRDHDQG